MKFNQLNVPSYWQNYWTRYPEGYTILEALFSWVAQVDSMVDNQNKLNVNVEQFRKEIDDFVGRFDGSLQDEVANTLEDWQDSGFLNVVINEALTTRTSELEQNIKNMHYDVTDYGVVGDGITDDTPAINALLSTLSDGDTIYFPNLVYKTTDTINITRSIHFEMKGYILADHSNIGILVKNNEPQGNFSNERTNGRTLNVDADVVRVTGKGYEILPTCIGMEVWNAFYGVFHIKRMKDNNTGLVLVGDKYGTGYAGTSYCHIHLGLLVNYKQNIVLRTNSATGYVTQNQFYGGSLSGARKEGVETIHINLNNVGGSVLNENTFFGTSLEGTFNTAVKGYRALNNKFISVRIEVNYLELLFDFDACRFNQFTNSDYVVKFMREGKFNDNSLTPSFHGNTFVSFNDYLTGFVEYYDGIFYIKPLRNTGGNVAGSNNGVDPTQIPSNWKQVEIVHSGLSDNFIYSARLPLTGSDLTVPFRHSDHIILGESANALFTKVLMSNPPLHSTEFTLSFRYALTKPITIGGDATITGVIDKTGTGLVAPTGTIAVKMYYRYYDNRIYITEYI